MRWIVEPVLRSPVRFAAGISLLAAGALALAAWSAPRAFDRELAQPFEQPKTGWKTSTTCRSCHPDQYASWHRTFHRTMTQVADRHSVRGAFDGRIIRYQDVTVRPLIDGERFVFEITYPGARPVRLPVLYTVGSRRYQQYLARLPGRGENLYRLPVLWHLEERRWVHMNGVFLGADGRPFDTHLALWNQNCIFCHNTGPAPGLTNWDEMMARQARGEPVNPQRDARHRSRVAELGIACESCHGPGSAHAARNRSPLRRYYLHLTGRDDPTIINPAELPQAESAGVCGQCHGQRVPRSVDELVTWVTDGPTYRAGERLAEHVDNVWRDTADLWGQNDVFRLRFWADGTARLTAYEYQGLLQSPCYERGTLTCLSCHVMHGGDVRGQLPPENRGNRACLACHQELAGDVPGHTFHAPRSSGSNCYECHMPRLAYGIMEIHRSHRIESPDAARDAEAGRPHACTSCHLDRSLAWAAAASREWWDGSPRPPSARADGADPETVDAVASLLAGDPVQRAVAARLAGRGDSPLSARQRAFLLPHLLAAMDDDYPAVRRFAHRSLTAIAADLAAGGVDPGWGDAVAAFDFMAPREARRRRLADLRRRWSQMPKDALGTPPPGSLLDAAFEPLSAEVERLRALGRARSQDIHIGE